MFVKGKKGNKPGNSLPSAAVTCLRERRAAGRRIMLGVTPQIPDEYDEQFCSFCVLRLEKTGVECSGEVIAQLLPLF